MRLFPQPLDLPESTFILLRDLIHERTGAYYEADRRDIFADKLLPRLGERGVDSFLDYYYLLKYDAAADEEWRHVMDALAVPETFFWREFDQVRALVEVLVPKYLASNPSEPLRIWSAACSTGEEALTIAIALNEAGWFYRLPVEINATDASPLAIAKARQGLYRERSFRNFSPQLREKYFQKQDGSQWRVVPDIHSRIKWGTANLYCEAEVKALARSPVIFCRNVFIYFSEQAIRKTVRLFYQNMPAPGYLFVGVSESLLRLTTDFELQEIGGAFVYVKR
jgi:chemotaxis protein methyltransferase CheR